MDMDVKDYEDIESQNAQILKHLESGKSITALEALELFGCMRLGARIYDLRKKHDIRSDLEYEKRADGRTKRYARYWLVHEN